MSNHPADRDLRTYRWATTLCTIGIILSVFAMGMLIKQERRNFFPQPKPIAWGASCYRMVDDVVVCR